MGAERFDFGVEGFGGGIGQPALEIVDNGNVVVFKGLKHFVELVVAEGFHLVVPSRKIKPTIK